MEKWLDASSDLMLVQAEKRKEITPVVQGYETKEKLHSDAKKQAELILTEYAAQQRETLFVDGKKSTSFAGGVIGFKKNPAKLESADWDKSLEHLKEWNPEYVIERCEIDKKGILRNADKFDDDDLEGFGLAITQEEKFYVKA